MKYLMLIPVLCLVGFGCTNNQGSSQYFSQQESPSDSAISAEVRNRMSSDPSLSNYGNSVTVSTNNGVVRLKGNVATQRDANKIVKMTKNVDGVQSVDNQLVVTGS
jgi:hyperosmotically inducible protein